MTVILTPPPPSVSIPRELALGVAGAAAFGIAAALGHGAVAMLRGAWMAPVLFAGSCLLATPPLYLASTWSNADTSAERLLADVASVLGRAGLVLLGLAAPAAFFSATLRTRSAWALLVVVVLAVGITAVRAVARRTLDGRGPTVVIGWTALAVALGARMLFALAHHLPLTP